MDEGHRAVRRTGPGLAGDVAGDDPDERAAVGRGGQGDLAGADVLVARRRPLLGGGQVDPELEAVEQPAARDEPLRRLLDVEDPGPGGHPLGVTVGDDAATAVRVLVLEHAVDHVGHRLEPTVRVPRRPLRLARGVFDLPHLVEMDERVEVGQVDPGERPPDREPLPLEALRRVRDPADARARERRPGPAPGGAAGR